MDLVGAVPIKVNGRYAITVTEFSAKKATPTKTHAGAFGNFGQSQGALKDITGSFKVQIPKTGFEFNWELEFGQAGGGRIVAEVAPGAFKGYREVRISEESLAVLQGEGNTSATVTWRATFDGNVG